MASRTLYQARVAAGLCGKCGDPPAPGSKQCARHLAASAAAMTARYKEDKQTGTCVTPGCDASAEAGAVCCAVHAAAHAAMLVQRRDDKAVRGECIRCPLPVLPGHALCSAHVQMDREEGRQEYPAKLAADRERRALYREHGLCPLCGDVRADGVAMCERHREHAREYAVLYRRGDAQWLETWLDRVAREERETDAAIADRKLAAWRARVAAEERGSKRRTKR